MNSEEKEFANLINEKSSFKPNFDKISSKINYCKKPRFIIINSLLGLELLTSMFCLIMAISIISNGNIEEVSTPENNFYVYITLFICMMFVLIVTLFIKYVFIKLWKKGSIK